VKPFDLEDLITLIAETLRHGRQRLRRRPA